MAEEARTKIFDIRPHAENAFLVVIIAIAISVTVGIGHYIIYELNRASGNQLTVAVNLITEPTSLVGTILNFLYIGAVAALGIALVLYLMNVFPRRGGGGKE